MLIRLRKMVIRLLGAQSGAGVLVGSYITVDGERQVSIVLKDGWTEAGARLTPKGARAIADQLKTWADMAELGNTSGEWKAIFRYAVANKQAAADVETTDEAEKSEA